MSCENCYYKKIQESFVTGDFCSYYKEPQLVMCCNYAPICSSCGKEMAEYKNRNKHLCVDCIMDVLGITSVPSTMYSYYDASDNYIGDSEHSDIEDIIEECGGKLI